MTSTLIDERATHGGPPPGEIRATRPRRVGVGEAHERNASQYSELAATIKQMGLMKRRPGWYLARCLVLLAAYVAGFAALFALGSSPWQLLVAAYFAENNDVLATAIEQIWREESRAGEG